MCRHGSTVCRAVGVAPFFSFVSSRKGSQSWLVPEAGFIVSFLLYSQNLKFWGRGFEFSTLVQVAGHIITENLKIISDSIIRSFISKGPKYRLPSQIDFNKYREEIAVTLNKFCKRWFRREHVECYALNS